MPWRGSRLRELPVADLPVIVLAAAIALFYLLPLAALWPVLLPGPRWTALALVGPFVWLSIVDLRDYIIPDRAVLAVFLVTITYLGLGEPELLVPRLSTAAVLLLLGWGFGALYFRWRGEDGLGLGDAKLFAAGAGLVDGADLWLVLLIAAGGGILAFLLAKAFGRRPAGTALAFGPFLAYALYSVFIWTAPALTHL